MPDDVGLLTERVTLRVQLLSIVVALAGLILLYFSTPVDHAGYHKSGALLEETGAALFIAGILAVIWELRGKRAFADEILAKANMARDLAEAGVDSVVANFRDPRVNWINLFKNACRLDIFIAFGTTWRNTQAERIEELLSDKDAKLRIVLPDPDDTHIVDSLATRFRMTKENVKRTIEEARAFFQHRKEKAKGTVEIYFSGIVPVFSFYRFNNKAVFALYNHRVGKEPVPTVICDNEGFLYKYITAEFEGILADGRTRRVDKQVTGDESERAKPPEA